MTLKEFMHTPNSYLDNLAREAEFQRTTDVRELLKEESHDD